MLQAQTRLTSLKTLKICEFSYASTRAEHDYIYHNTTLSCDMNQGWAIAEITVRRDDPEMSLVEFTELLETINAIYVGAYNNQREIKRMDVNPLRFEESDFQNQRELHRFIGQLQDAGILGDMRSNTRKWAPPTAQENIQIRRLEKQSPALIELAGVGVPILVALWFANNVEAEYSVTEEYGPGEELESRTVEKRVAYNASSISELLDVLKRRFK